MTAEDYEKKYIELSKDLCRNAEDYTKSKVKRHNKAALEMVALARDMSEEPEIADKVFADLLENEDTAIKSFAASQCLKYGFHVKKAEKVLKKIRRGKDKFAAFQAEMTLKVWHGKVPGKSL